MVARESPLNLSLLRQLPPNLSVFSNRRKWEHEYTYLTNWLRKIKVRPEQRKVTHEARDFGSDHKEPTNVRTAESTSPF